MRVLLTGFAPWGEWERNPSGEAAETLNGSTIEGCEIVSAVLPVEFGEDTKLAFPLIERHEPSFVISLGLNASAAALHLERVAINLRSDGETEGPIVEKGPAAYFSTLPVAAIRSEIDEEDVPVRYSYSAGTFLCNHIMYSILHHLSGQLTPSGFIHIPRLPEQASEGDPSMSLETVVRGVEATVRSLVRSTDG